MDIDSGAGVLTGMPAEEHARAGLPVPVRTPPEVRQLSQVRSADAGEHMSPAGSIPPSCLHEVFRTAEARERVTGRPVIKLHVGEPYFPPPRAAVDALVAAARDGRTAYTSAEGMPALREALAAKLEEHNGHRTAPDRIFVAPGSCQGLAALFQSLVHPGDELLLPDLHWPIHLQQCLLAGFRPVFYPLDDQYRPDLDRLAAVASPRTRAILVNTPANPTGAVMDSDQLKTILELAHHHGWQVINDEAYEHFRYDADHVSLGSLERDVPERDRRVHSTFSFSKSYAMTGYRLGYVVTPNQQAARALRVVQEASIVGPSTPVQYAGLAALSSPSAGRVNGDLVRANRDRALPALRAAGLLADLPAGGWYAMLDVSRTGLTADEFAARLLATQHVSVAPGGGFALRPELDPAGRVRSAATSAKADRLVRLAFCGDPDQLDAGVRGLVDFAAGLRSQAREW
jgi:aspartate aminotransferase